MALPQLFEAPQKVVFVTLLADEIAIAAPPSFLRPIVTLVPIIGARNSKRYSAFASLDARVSRRFDLPRGELTVFLEVSNLTNRRNVCCSDFDIEEDENGNEMLDAGDDFWPPLLPAIGVLWEF